MFPEIVVDEGPTDQHDKKYIIKPPCSVGNLRAIEMVKRYALKWDLFSAKLYWELQTFRHSNRDKTCHTERQLTDDEMVLTNFQ